MGSVASVVEERKLRGDGHMDLHTDLVEVVDDRVAGIHSSAVVAVVVGDHNLLVNLVVADRRTLAEPVRYEWFWRE